MKQIITFLLLISLSSCAIVPVHYELRMEHRPRLHHCWLNQHGYYKCLKE